MTTILEAFNESCRQVALLVVVAPLAEYVNAQLAEGRTEAFSLEEFSQVLSFPPLPAQAGASAPGHASAQSQVPVYAPPTAPISHTRARVHSPPSSSPALSPSSGCVRILTRCSKKENIGKPCGKTRVSGYEYCVTCMKTKEVQKILSGTPATPTKSPSDREPAAKSKKNSLLGDPPAEIVVSVSAYRDGLKITPEGYILKEVEEENNFKVVALARLVDGEEKKLDKNDRIKLISKSFVISDEMFTQPDKQPIQEYEEYKTAAASASAPVSQLPSLSSSHKTAVNLAQPTASISRPSSSLSQNTILGSSISQRIPDMPALRK